MYFYLKGIVVHKFDDYIVIDINGIGYQVLVMHSEDFPLGEEVLVYIVHVVREDEEYFVGFSSLKEKKVFNQLCTCKGIGPKTALSALRGISVDDFILAIQNEDVKKLKKLDGIGPKAASQIILDLKGSIAPIENNSKRKFNQNQEDAILGLKSLGFKVKDIEDCLLRINDDSLSTQEYVTLVLRMIKK
ncbi:MAG: Holliday junction branch migration protein RuvA [Bacillales bacterium]|nr:Holliday junction branch migration protein RuvA [Bacillales bacterium]